MSAAHHIVFDCDGTLLNMEQGGTPFAGIPELLHRLQALDFQLYVWTGRDRASLQRLLTEKNLLRFFVETSAASEAAPKPYPEALQTMLKGVDPQSCVMIGDSWADMKGARLFGCFAIGAIWNSPSGRAALEEFGAHEVVSSPEDCYNAVLRILEG